MYAVCKGEGALEMRHKTQQYPRFLVRDEYPHFSSQLICILSHYLQSFIHPNGGWEWDF